MNQAHARGAGRRPGALEKSVTGIRGLDEVTRGGLPKGRLTLLFGGAGSGKTVLALQTLVNGAKNGEPGVFVAFEENRDVLLQNASSFGWGIEELMPKKLRVLDSQLSPETVRAGGFDLKALLAVLSVVVDEIGAKRVVLDAVDVLLSHMNDPAAERNEIYRIREWLLQRGLTGILTAKVETWESIQMKRHSFAQFMADCAVLLERRLLGTVSERGLTVLKYRGSGFSENKVPLVIGERGMEVAEQLHAAVPAHPTNERVPTGVERLDTMVGGGYLRNASVLITGAPGTAKSTLCCAFVAAACARRERALYVGFDEHADETVRNMASVGVLLQPAIDAGMLRMVSAVSTNDSAEVHLMRIRNAITEHGATCAVIDPVSALTNASEAATAQGAVSRFIHWCKVRGVTLLGTSLVGGADPSGEASPINVSTISDVWLHLRYGLSGGERNRAITIIKARGTSHSNQVRELVLGDRGITLADVYEVGGEVLMGTLRWERENAIRDAEQREARLSRERQRELERSQADLRSAAEKLRRESEANEAELHELQAAEQRRLAEHRSRLEERLQIRGADADTRSGPGSETAPAAREKRRRAGARGPTAKGARP